MKEGCYEGSAVKESSVKGSSLKGWCREGGAMMEPPCWSTSGWYASYWNAFLFCHGFHHYIVWNTIAISLHCLKVSVKVMAPFSG